MSKSIYGHSFQFWQTYFESAECTSNPQRFIYGIAKFVFTGKVPEDLASWSITDLALWNAHLPSFSCSRRQMLRNQGAPIGNTNGPNGRRGNNQSTNQSTNQSNRNRIENREIEIDTENNNITRARYFTPPSIEEVEEYSRTIANKRHPIKAKRFDAASFAKSFVERYTANGWQTASGEDIKSWKMAVSSNIGKVL
jgi:hypothetical protein